MSRRFLSELHPGQTLLKIITIAKQNPSSSSRVFRVPSIDAYRHRNWAGVFNTVERLRRDCRVFSSNNHSYRVSKIALQYHNASGRTIYAQPEANSNRSRQQSHCIYSEPPIVLLKFSIICTETQCFCHFLLSSIAPLATHPLSREDFS